MLVSDTSSIQSSGSESDDDASNSSDSHGLLDTEAVEFNDGDTDSENEELSSSEFHPFVRLPLELRRRIWELFCPDLTCKSRVLEFRMNPAPARHQHAHGQRDSRGNIWTASPDFTLEMLSFPVRCLLAVHRESRAVVLDEFPDTLAVNATTDLLFRFHKDRDVLVLNGLSLATQHTEYHLPGFAQKATQVALPTDCFPFAANPVRAISEFLALFVNLKRVFFVASCAMCRTKQLTWCASELTRTFYTSSTEKSEAGLEVENETIYSWPNVDQHADFAKYQVPEVYPDNFIGLREAMRQAGIDHYPMISWEGGPGIRRYNLIKRCPDISYLRELNDSSSSSSSESETDSNQYESDGIDDADIVEPDDASEDEILPGPINDSEPSDDGSHDIDGLSARFSSPELEPDSSRAHDTVPTGVPRRPKRRVVSDSDDEEESPGEPAAKRARTGHVILSDSEDDDDARATIGGASVRSDHIVISDSDSKSGKNDEGAANQPGTQDGFDDSDDSDESGDAPPERITLAERLQRFRDENPVPASENDSLLHSEEEGSVEVDGSDDEEEEIDEEDSENGLVDGMAEDTDDDSGDGSGDEW